MIDVQRLAVLREVARAGSFAGAAAALRHTPSAVSQQIAALERGAGVTLVERSSRGVTLTDAGRALLATADAIHAELQAAAQRLRALTAEGPQALTVVTFPSAGEPLLAPALTALTAMTAAAGSPVEVTVIEAEPDEALASVRDGRADLALLYHLHTAAMPRAWPAAAGPGHYIPLLADHFRLLVPAGHPLASRPAVSLADFADERWIRGWGDAADVTDMLAALSGFRPRVACRSSDYRFMSALVGAGERGGSKYAARSLRGGIVALDCVGFSVSSLEAHQRSIPLTGALHGTPRYESLAAFSRWSVLNSRRRLRSLLG